MSFPSGPGCTHSLVAARARVAGKNRMNSATQRMDIGIRFLSSHGWSHLSANTIPRSLAFAHSRGTLRTRLGFTEESHVIVNHHAGKKPAILGCRLLFCPGQYRLVDRIRPLRAPTHGSAARGLFFP